METIHETSTDHLIKILFVDDEENVLRSLRRLFATDNVFDVKLANSGKEALEIIKNEPNIGIIVSDQKMPGMSGVDFLEQAKNIIPDAPRMLITGYPDINVMEDAMNRGGACMFIKKPWEDEKLTQVIREAAQQFILKKENRRLQDIVLQQNDELQNWNSKLEQNVEEQTREITRLLENEKLLSARATAAAKAEKEKVTELEQSYEELESIASELDKARSDLEEANREIKEASIQMVQNEKMSALGEMTAGVAHELNQPLNAVKLISQDILRDIAKDRFDKEYLADDLKEIVGEVDRMSTIIDHMRLFSRRTVDDGVAEADVNSAVEGVFKLLGKQLTNHNILVTKDMAPDLPPVSIDQIRLEQVLVNIINNARQALESFCKEEMKIEIRSCLEENKKGNMVAVYIKDNAGGVPEDIKVKIFEPFYTTKRPGKGTGLGLSISSKIVADANGKINLDVEEGIGSTFGVLLPVRESTDDDKSDENQDIAE